MLLSLESTLRVVFTIYAIFWTVVVVVLLIVVGALLKRHDRLVKEHQQHGQH